MNFKLTISLLLGLTFIFFSSFKKYNSNADAPGCTNVNACNYDPAATSNDGSCLFIGQACPNVDVCTMNSVVDENCNCVGTPRICDDLNPCTEDFCNPAFGCFSVPITIDSDGDGICDAGDTCPNVFGQIGSPCDDGNLCTENDVIDANCNCVGVPKVCFAPGPCQTSECDPNTGICVVTTIPDSDGDGICDPDDNCPNIPGVIGSSCSSGDFCFINEVIDENCNCVGEPLVCDDGDPCTADFCDPLTGCYFVPILDDEDGDGICDAGDSCPSLFGQIGSPCDDANPYTVNDLIDANCSCTGFALDSDGDGLTDQDEVEIYFTDPFQDDTDSDGLSDWAEVFESLTSPILADTDGDGCSDLLEYAKLCPDSPPCGEPACVGDVNSDGVVNTGDLNTLLSVYGQICP